MLSEIQIQKKIKSLSNKLNAGRFDDVIEEASILLKKNKHQIFFNVLTLAYQGIGELKKAEETMDQALKLNPNNPYFLNNMGTTQHKMGNYDLAEKYFFRGLKIVPNYIHILNNLGNLKRDLNDTDQALEYYKKSLSFNSKNIATLLNISICHQSLGNFTEAKYFLNNLLKIKPSFTIADRLLASMKKYIKDDEHLESMIKKSNHLNLNELQLANLFFALGKANEDLKEYNQSFYYYNKGNNLLKKNSNFNIENEKKNFLQIKNFFSNNDKKVNFKQSKKIIFIVGMPRSGTSLVEQIISSHKNVYGGGELIFLKELIENKILDKIENKTMKDIKNIKSLFQDININYTNKISLIDDSSKIFTDKSPLNFKYIGFIKNIFPNSKIINCERNSLNVCWSNYKNYFGESLPFTNNLKDLGTYYKLYEDLMKFWKITFSDEIYDLNYTKLINNSEDEIRKLLKFCELEWDQNCLNHEKNTKSIKTASSNQARKSINKSGLKTSDPFSSYLTELSKILKN
jgi:tetratricopeptide (TPR) repeat protein